jgi:hypothetical protein
MTILVPFYPCDARVEQCERSEVWRYCLPYSYGRTAYFNNTWHFACHNSCAGV